MAQDSYNRVEQHSQQSPTDSTSTLPVETHDHDIEKQPHQDHQIDAVAMNVDKKSDSDEPQPVQKVVTALDWTGADDPENPENWPTWKKAYTLVVVGLQCFVVTFASSVYSPAVVQVSKQFHVSTEVAIIPLTVYVIGLGFGPVISAPLSETFGRRFVYISLLPISLLFQLGAGLANNFATLVVCRFLAGAIGSGCLAVGAGTNTDLYPPLRQAPRASLFLVAPFLGPAFGPPVGSYAAQYMSWRWTQWTILMIGAFSTILSLGLKESYKKVILQQRAKRLGLPPPPNPMNTLSPSAKLKMILTITIFRPIRMLVTEPIVLFLAIYTAFNFGVLFAFFAAFPLVFQSPYPEIQVYHFNQGESGLVFLAIGVGLALAWILFLMLDRLIYVPRAKKVIAVGGNERSVLLPPEQRTHSAIVGCFMLPVSLFWFAWTARPDIHWIVPILACIPFGCGNLMVFFTAVMYQVDTYGARGAASAMSANGILRYVFGAVFPLFARQMYTKLGVAWATSLLGFVTIALLPLPFILLHFGPKLRARSQYT